MSDCTNNDVLRAMREAAWERAKAELWSVLSAAYMPHRRGHMEDYSGLRTAIKEFIDTVEENDLLD